MTRRTPETIEEESRYNNLSIGNPEYRDGSAKKGWYQYQVTIATDRANNRKSRVVVGDKLPTRRAAEASAIAKADQESPVFRAELAEWWFSL